MVLKETAVKLIFLSANQPWTLVSMEARALKVMGLQLAAIVLKAMAATTVKSTFHSVSQTLVSTGALALKAMVLKQAVVVQMGSRGITVKLIFLSAI